MAIDKKMHYEMQGDEKPARNYLGKQKTVRAPVKWKSSPEHPTAHLAYITKAEEKILLDKNLYGSLKGKPNRGPSGLPSLQGAGDYTRDRSPEGRQDAGGNERSRHAQAQHEKHMKDILTGQKNIGQTSAVSDRVRQGAVPEYVNTPDGMKYVGSAYKDTGKRGFISRLLGGANQYGYAPIRGLKSIQTRGVPGQAGFEYYSDDEDVGDIKPGYGGRVFGGLMSLLTGIPFVGSAVGKAYDYGKGIFGKPTDMSQYNKLGLFGIPKGTLDEDDKIPVQGDTAWSDGTFTWGANNNINTNKGIPYTNKFTMSGNTYPVNQNFVNNMTTYTDAIEQGKTIGNDEQMFIDDNIAELRGYR